MSGITELLDIADEAYYNGQQIMSDIEYDKLRDKAPKETVGVKTEANENCKLSRTMYSMLKTTPENFYKQFSKNTTLLEPEIIVMPKYDGISVSLDYEDNKLVRAFTRGDGVYGAPILDRVKVCAPELLDFSFQSLGIKHLEGEIIVSKENFEKHFSNKYISPRQTVTSVLRPVLKEFVNEETKYLDIIIWDIEFEQKGYQESNFLSKLVLCKNIGINVAENVWFGHANYFTEELSKDIIKSVKTNCKYGCDGIIVRITNQLLWESCGVQGIGKGQYPNGSIAIKLDIMEQDSLIGEVDNINWSMGIDGILHPIIHLKDPLRFSDAFVQNISGGSYSNIKTKGIGVGSFVRVIKSGDIIPHITEVLVKSDKINLTNTCPFCDSKLLGIETLVTAHICCSNPNCSEKNLKRMESFFSNIGIKGFPVSFVMDIIKNKNTNSIVEFLKIPYEELSKYPGMGLTNLTKVTSELKKTLNEKTLDWYIAYSGYFASSSAAIGSAIAKTIVEHYEEENVGLTPGTLALKNWNENKERFINFIPIFKS